MVWCSRNGEGARAGTDQEDGSGWAGWCTPERGLLQACCRISVFQDVGAGGGAGDGGALSEEDQEMVKAHGMRHEMNIALN